MKVKPIIALTMGDPAGVGPEVCVKALSDPAAYSRCRPFIIGDVAILRRAALVSGCDIVIRRIDSPETAVFEPGCIEVMPAGAYDDVDILFGKPQALAGQMACDAIRCSVELGLAKRIDAVCTAPIHKGAVKLAGVPEIGHTEMYMDWTGSTYALTLFVCRQLRVFFLSRHLSLMDACRYVTTEHLLEALRRIHSEMEGAGFKAPLIAVAGLNPHNGDGGMFGDEEITQIVPAVEAAQAEGIRAVGPCPADSVFAQGKTGKYDAILSLYHDQGHIACKTLDFARTVTLTLGLPFLRSSVDHGTAFDIAGTGTADATGMRAAMDAAVDFLG
jgi:4-hydroxythreonine-4-phosphate dehydrogenase